MNTFNNHPDLKLHVVFITLLPDANQDPQLRAILCSVDPIAALDRKYREGTPGYSAQVPAEICEAKLARSRFFKNTNGLHSAPWAILPNGAVRPGFFKPEELDAFLRTQTASYSNPAQSRAATLPVTSPSPPLSAVGSPTNSDCVEAIPRPKFRNIRDSRTPSERSCNGPKKVSTQFKLFVLRGRISGSNGGINHSVHGVHVRSDADISAHLVDLDGRLKSHGGDFPLEEITKASCPFTESWSAVVVDRQPVSGRYTWNVAFGGACGKASREEALRGALEGCRERGGCRHAMGGDYGLAFFVVKNTGRIEHHWGLEGVKRFSSEDGVRGSEPLEKCTFYLAGENLQRFSGWATHQPMSDYTRTGPCPFESTLKEMGL